MDAKRITNERLPRAVLDQLLTLGSSWEEPSDLAGFDEIFRSFVTSAHENEQWRLPESHRTLERPLITFVDSQEGTAHELRTVREFAKANVFHSNGASLPKEVASAVYFYCLAIAFVRFGDLHSSLSALQIQSGWTWTLAQTWLDPRCRPTIDTALKTFTALNSE